MTTIRPHGRKWLLGTARAVASALKIRSEGTCLRVRRPRAATETNTDGWAARIGDLGQRRPTIEVWFDRFTGHFDRKLYACFRCDVRPKLLTVTKHVDEHLIPVHEITSDDTVDEKYLRLERKLPNSHFREPFLERYAEGRTFYGIYDPAVVYSKAAVDRFCERAVAFFESVARALPHAKSEDEKQEAYPQWENRKVVAAHLRRERSRLLAALCKTRDNYTCAACGTGFAESHSGLGPHAVEAHHLVPLGQLHDNVRTSLDDLVTVCANCHRMLHRLEGGPDDLKRLRLIIRKQLRQK